MPKLQLSNELLANEACVANMQHTACDCFVLTELLASEAGLRGEYILFDIRIRTVYIVCMIACVYLFCLDINIVLS